LLGLIAILLLYDFVGPFFYLAGEKDDVGSEIASDGKSEDVFQDLLQKSHDGRVYVAYCTS